MKSPMTRRNLALLLAFASFSTVVSAGGLVAGALNIGITLQASCEVGARVTKDGYQVQNHDCAGASRFRVMQQVGSDRSAFDLLPRSTLTLAADKTPTVVTLYW